MRRFRGFRAKRIRPPRRRRANHFVLSALGWCFLVLGVLGLFLPILQGVLFLLVGVFLLSMVSPRARLLRQQLGARFPKARHGLDQAETWIKVRFKKLFS